MSTSRRDFLKVAGCSLLGAGAVAPAISAAARVGAGHQKATSADSPRWALLIDIRKCLDRGDCTECMNACHRVHNVPRIDQPEHEIKWIWKESYSHVFPTQAHAYTEDALRNNPVLVMCNHCEKPPCVKVCPTKATFKRDDGIVIMDMHRCIGCRYCMAACPYGSRSFNWKDPKPLVRDPVGGYPTRTKGVVEKCNLCAERLARGLSPACVESSATSGCGALSFGDLNDSSSGIVAVLQARHNIRRKPFLGTEPHVFYLV